MKTLFVAAEDEIAGTPAIAVDPGWGDATSQFSPGKDDRASGRISHVRTSKVQAGCRLICREDVLAVRPI